jgi:hypothetical protein
MPLPSRSAQPAADASGAPVIHIGYHRTGTTWFQTKFYPAVTNGSYLPRALVRETLIAPNAFAFCPERARAVLLQHASGRRPLICEENLSGYIQNGGMGGLLSKEVVDRLHATFPGARIVVFLRSQPQMVAAAYAQYVKAGGTHSPSRYVRAQQKVKGAAHHWYKAPLFTLDHFEYGPLLAYYASRFGRAAITVKLYEEFAEGQQDFLEAFAAELGLKVPVEELDLVPVNASLTPRRLAILRRLNLLTSRSVFDKRSYCDLDRWYQRRWNWLGRLERLIPATRARPLLLPRRLLDQIEDRFRASNAALAAAWDLPLARYGYPLP